MNNDPTLVPSYRPLTAEQITQIETCISHGIDVAELRAMVRAVWPAATTIQIDTSVEYDDGSSYYWTAGDISIFEGEHEVALKAAHDEVLDDIRDSLSLGAASGEDGDDFITIDLDTPTLSQLFQQLP